LGYDLRALAESAAEALRQAEHDLRLEQAVYGLDSLSEAEIQELLAVHLRNRYEVAREVPYPSATSGRRRGAAGRLRCDIVITPPGRPLIGHTGEPGLFDAVGGCPPCEALWLEVKGAWQFREGGIPHGGYGAQWRKAIVADLRKMEADPEICHAALLLVVFTESSAIVEKDIELFEAHLTRQEVLARQRQVRSFPILERIGHRVCTVAIWPTVQKTAD